MIDKEPFEKKLTEIGDRFLHRTLGEIVRIREMLTEGRQTGAIDYLALQHAAHKIHGSGAMFGFDAIGDAAGELERLAQDGAGQSAQERVERCEQLLQLLEEQTKSAAQQRGLA